ncbi:MAG: hypothetical protein KC502_06630 [Myxococcales bacterium]|nr:hypothetical protein [Myxococcales bacterium]
MRHMPLIATLLGLSLLGCTQKPPGPRQATAPTAPPVTPATRTISGLPVAATPTSLGCGKYARAERLGKLPKRVREASGLVVSRRDPSVLWTHNDGTQGRLFGVEVPSGKLRAVVRFPTLRPRALDWEELSAAPCAAGAPSSRCLMVGDTGDNDDTRLTIAFHRFAEPNPRGGKQRVTQVETMIAHYPKRASHNSEAFVVDGKGVVWLWTKAKGHTALYRAPFRRGQAVLHHVARIDTKPIMVGSEGARRRLTAATWDDRAGRLLLRSYGAAWELCLGQQGLGAMPQAKWHRVTVAHERKGEAVAYGAGGFYHVAEGKRRHLYRLVRQ